MSSGSFATAEPVHVTNKTPLLKIQRNNNTITGRYDRLKGSLRVYLWDSFSESQTNRPTDCQLESFQLYCRHPRLGQIRSRNHDHLQTW